MATPLHFGDTKSPLYGVFHPAAQDAGRRPAALLCNPFGEEAIRAFRICRLLAEKLALAGAPVLRFDYHATGDSSGACEEASLRGYSDSILEAHAELLDMSGARQAVWIGLRLGAAAAIEAATRAAPAPLALILWDPVLSGADYLRELRSGHQAAIESQIGVAPQDADPPTEALGFALPAEFANELLRLDLLRLAKKPAAKIAVIAGEGTDTGFRETLQGLGAEVVWREHVGEASWNSDNALNSFVVPARTLDIVVEEALR